QNIPDPYQHDQAFFDQTCRNIQSYVQDWRTQL
ncbi:low molecular weight phosphotyrosine protein phosphatase, partial [Acinetobacter baumannii]